MVTAGSRRALIEIKRADSPAPGSSAFPTPEHPQDLPPHGRPETENTGSASSRERARRIARSNPAHLSKAGMRYQGSPPQVPCLSSGSAVRAAVPARVLPQADVRVEAESRLLVAAGHFVRPSQRWQSPGLVAVSRRRTARIAPEAPQRSERHRCRALPAPAPGPAQALRCPRS
jgi:hypothetical protein